MTTITLTSKQDFEQLFAKLNQDIQQLDNTIHSVEQFLQHVAAGIPDGVFDDQDRIWVEDDLKRLRAERQAKDADRQNRQEIYEQSVLKLERILNQRKQIIEDADRQTDVFRMRPELLKKFAQKRATLMKLVEQGKKDLQK